MIKAEKKKLKLYSIDYNLLAAPDLRQSHYQILLIILLKEFIELNVNIDRLIKNVKHAELHTKITVAFLNTQTLKIT